jgi:pyridoxal phosphate enzyme (YggS family)
MRSLEQGPILANYKQVLAQIEQAAHSVHRDSSAIKLVVVTKGHPVLAVKEALAAGVRVFGENYVEEGITKMLACPDQNGVEWHMIGHVQSRKAQPVCEYYAWVHSLDSSKLAQRLDRFSGELGCKLPVLLECNVSGEESKYGWPAWDERSWKDLAGRISPVLALPNLDVRGLMTMAPFLPDPEQARPYFRRLRRLRDFLAHQFPRTNWRELSMGMSADFQVAVQEGATIVRVGTAIMGPRPV